MTGLTVTALAVGIVGNVVSRSLVLDAIALWPIAAVALPAALIGLKGGRHLALAPLVLLSWLLVSVGVHLSGVAGMPSSAAAVRTDLAGIESARLTVAVDDLSLRIGAGPFEVAPVPVGGASGVPVVERVSGTSATALVVTDDPDASVWFRFGEYRIRLDQGVAWDLRVTVSGFDIDARDLELASARLVADTGRLELGQPPAAATVEVGGDIEVSVPSDAAVTVIGTTRVPSDWTVSDNGATAPAEGEGWTIRVTSGSVRIVSR